ncbi:hypothetical protein JW835_01285 [bacterium]|nr:hypothetical protein [bacterium]
MCILIMILISCTALYAAESPFPACVDSLIHQGTRLNSMAQFDSAFTTFQQVNRLLPEHPAGSFYLAATLHSKMMHYETDRWELAFSEYRDSTMSRADTWLANRGEDPWIYFFRGSIQTYMGLYQAKRGSLVKGFVSAEGGVDDLIRAIRLDSTCYDAYIGIGNYKYWSGKFYKYLRWLPFIRDERSQGEAEVRLGMEKGCFFYWVGVNSLAWIKYDREHFEEAIRLFELGAAEFDSSLIWLWGLADAHKKGAHYRRALNYYYSIIGEVESDTLESGYNEVLARWKAIQCLEKLELYPEIINHAKAIQNRPVEAGMFDKAMEYRDKARKAQQRAEKKLK